MLSGIMEVYLLILIFSVVQSLFGVGLLLFGTPIMLILGYEYSEALLYLLPASAALSWSQVRDFRHVKLDGDYRKLFFLVSMPLLALGMVLASHFDLNREIKIFVILMLLMAFVLRTFSGLRENLQTFMRKHLIWAIGSMGLIHGLSNMGGSILTPLVSGLYKDKDKVLAGVSFDYAFMASLQLLILVLIKGESLGPKYLLGGAISLAIRYLIGKRVFAFTNESNYQRLLNGLILANALMLGINLIK